MADYTDYTQEPAWVKARREKEERAAQRYNAVARLSRVLGDFGIQDASVVATELAAFVSTMIEFHEPSKR